MEEDRPAVYPLSFPQGGGGDDLITIITMLRFLVFCLEHSDLSHRRD